MRKRGREGRRKGERERKREGGRKGERERKREGGRGDRKRKGGREIERAQIHLTHSIAFSVRPKRTH